MSSLKKVAVIGAGPAGLISGKYALAEGYDVNIIEQAATFGGTWVYTEKTGFDEDGFPIHSAMYKDLRTNVPKELMEVSDHHYPKEIPTSYVTADDVLSYFQTYIDKFPLQDHIKFNIKVEEVKPAEGSQWYIKTKNISTGQISKNVYDVVMICTGHYSWPNIPDIPGKETFKGIQVHSRDYRSSERFVGKKCVVVGMGLSGQDISRMLLKITDTVFVSHSLKKKPFIAEKLIEKPRIVKLNEHSAQFQDGTTEEVDAIIYCTGYEYRFPFLSDECDIIVEKGKFVKPLYKGIINIEHPSMAFIGLQSILAVIPMFELQARFFFSTLNNHFPLHDKKALYNDLEEEIQRKKGKGVELKHFHFIGNKENQKEYFEELASTAKITGIPNVINNLFGHVVHERMTTGLSNSLYRIIDDENYFKTSVN